MDIKNNIQFIKQNLPSNCKLVAVSKTQPVDIIQQAYNAGHRIFGENKAQELAQKYESLPKDIEWHMIGHLQTNKVKYIAPFVHLIQSVDSLKLLSEINKQAHKTGRTINCLLQVHIAKEETKYGFAPEEILRFIKEGAFTHFQRVSILGLMGMATFTDDMEQVRDEFSELKKFFDYLKSLTLPQNMEMKELSMGMSGDYMVAVGAGSTVVRVGTAIFGEREYKPNIQETK
jgi:PLP dependent protein